VRNLRGLGKWNASALDKERSLDALDRLDGNIRERREKEREKMRLIDTKDQNNYSHPTDKIKEKKYEIVLLHSVFSLKIILL